MFWLTWAFVAEVLLFVLRMYSLCAINPNNMFIRQKIGLHRLNCWTILHSCLSYFCIFIILFIFRLNHLLFPLILVELVASDFHHYHHFHWTITHPSMCGLQLYIKWWRMSSNSFCFESTAKLRKYLYFLHVYSRKALEVMSSLG